MKSILAAVALSLVATGAGAQSYPNKAIRWIVPYTPGGLTDTTTRLVTTEVEKILGQSIIVENRSGANSIIGAGLAAKAAPDGYTILSVIPAHAANTTLYEGKLPFDTLKSFEPISLAGITPLVLTVTNALPVSSVGELIDYAKKNPDKLSFGSSGNGSAAHLSTELLKQVAGIQMQHVAYKGTAPALTDLLAGHIQVLVDVPSSMMQHVRGGKAKALGIYATERLPGAKEVPTLEEAGGPRLESSSWVMFLAPAGTPKEIVDTLSKAVAQAVKSPELTQKLSELGIIPVGNTPDQARAFLADEIAKWSKVIKTGNIKVE